MFVNENNILSFFIVLLSTAYAIPLLSYDDITPFCTKESCGDDCVIPPFSSTSNSKLPDPFTMMSGTRMTLKSQWECRHAELAAQFQYYELGQKTPKPVGNVTGSMNAGYLVVHVEGNTFSVPITYPKTGSAPYPAMIYLDALSLMSQADYDALGVATIKFDTNFMGNQGGLTMNCVRGKGFFFDVNGADDGAGAIVAWAWGVSRIIDALEVTPEAKIDASRIGITGCSRNGKGALSIGALDERIALTVPQESGSGGTASWRVSEYTYSHGTQVQTLEEIVGECVWFRTSLASYKGRVNYLPIDHHELLGMVAPRGLLVLENTVYAWLGVDSCVNSATAAQMIFQGLDVQSNMGFSNSAHSHCLFNEAEGPYVKKFVQKFLLGMNVDTTVWNIEGGTVDKAMWIDWTVPNLQ